MKAELSGMDYTVTLSTADINALLDYGNPNLRDPKAQLPILRSPVLGNISEAILGISCTRDPELYFGSKANDQVIFEREKEGPRVKVSPTVLVSLLGERDFWVTRYDFENKIWIRKEEHPRIQK